MHRAEARPSRVSRLIAARARATEVGATWLGHTLRTAPGILGAGAVVVGCGQIWPPLAWLVGGGFLLAVDRNIP